MHYYDSQLGDWKTTLTKVRKVVHSIFPRELSPSRMLEKYASDSRKKAAQKITTATDKSVALNSAADAATSARIATLQLQTLPGAGATGTGTDQPTFESNVAPPGKAKEPFDATPYLWLAAFGLAGALYVMRSRK